MNNKIIMPILLAFVTLFSCKKETNSFQTDEFGMISRSFQADIAPWDEKEGDMPYECAKLPISVFYNKTIPGTTESQYSTGVYDGVGAVWSDKDNQYYFSQKSIPGAEKYNYFFVYPHHTTTLKSTYNGNSAIKARLFSVQYPLEDGIDPNYDYLIGRAIEQSGPDDNLIVNKFKRIVSSLSLKINDEKGVFSGASIFVATIAFPEYSKPLTGMFYTSHGTEFEDCSIIECDENAKGNAITLMYPDGLSPNGHDYVLNFATLPTEIPIGTAYTLTISTADNTFHFSGILTAPLSLHRDKCTKMDFVADIKSEGFTCCHSEIQFFNNLKTNSIPSVLTTVSGHEYKWSFSSCSRYSNEFGLPIGLKLVQSSSLLLPSIPQKMYKRIRVYGHEDSYNSMLNNSFVELQNKGKQREIQSFGHYNSSLYNGGGIEFSNMDETCYKMGLVVNFDDEGPSHAIPITAIVMDLVDGEYEIIDDDEVDYYQKYMDGDEIIIGDVSITRSKDGDPSLIKPDKLTYDLMRLGGIYFIDDSEGLTVEPDFGSNTTKTITEKDRLILIGRFGNSNIQTTLRLCEIRNNSTFATTFMNLRIEYVIANGSGSQQGIARNTSDTNHSTMRFVSCYLDYTNLNGTKNSYNLLWTSQGTNGYFERVVFDNCIIKMASDSDKIYSLFYNNKSRTSESMVDESVVINNCVFFTQSPVEGYVINAASSNTISNPKMSIKVTNCTFYNLYSGIGLLRSSNVKSMLFENNVIYDGFNAESSKYGWMMYSGTQNEELFRCSNNKFYCAKGATKWIVFNPSSQVVPYQENNTSEYGHPFLENYDLTLGYIPVDASIVGTGIGSTYTSKKFFPIPKK